MLVALNISRNIPFSASPSNHKTSPPLFLLLLANLLAGHLQLLLLRQLVGEETLRQVSNLFRVGSDVDGDEDDDVDGADGEDEES